MLLSWCDTDWHLQEVCLLVEHVPAPRAGEAFHAVFQKAAHSFKQLSPQPGFGGITLLELCVEAGLPCLLQPGFPSVGPRPQAPQRGNHPACMYPCRTLLPVWLPPTRQALAVAGLEKADIVAGVSDHEGAVRKGLRLLGVPLVGCGCHAVQLAPKHLLPQRPARAARESSSSGSGSSETTSEVAAPARPRQASPERQRLTALLREPLARSRRLVRHYGKNGDHFRELEADATEAHAPFKAFATETVTRWNSTLELLSRELFNDRALAVSAAKRGEREGIARLTPEQKTLQYHICVVLQPLRAATKTLEGEGAKARASLYLPVWERLLQSLADGGPLPPPSELQEAHAPVQPGALLPLARDCRRWLAKDLRRIRDKHLAGATGLRLLLASAYPDPRFKDRPRQPQEPPVAWATPGDLAEARAAVKELAVLATEHFPVLVERWQQAAAHPDNQPLHALAPAQRRPHRHLRRMPQPSVSEQPAGSAGAIVKRAAAQSEPPAKRARHLQPRRSEEEFLFGPAVAPGAPAAPVAAAQSLDQELESELVRFHGLPPANSLVDVLDWWRQHSGQLPRLALVARHLFALPASTASLERLFSAAGRAVNKRRPRLKDASAAALIYGHANLVRGHVGVPEDTQG